MAHTLLVSSGSQSAKSWNRTHSTHCTLFFWPCADVPVAAKVSGEILGQSGNRSRSRRRMLVRNNESEATPPLLGATLLLALALGAGGWRDLEVAPSTRLERVRACWTAAMTASRELLATDEGFDGEMRSGSSRVTVWRV